MSLHPAVLLLAWLGAMLALQALSLEGLWLALAFVLPVTLFLAAKRFVRLARRSRWLLVSLAVLFAFGTPGEYLDALPGVTREGLQLAGEHLLRLLLVLQLLALLLEELGVERLMSGLYLLLAPTSLFAFNRSQAVARLMLVLDYVQGSETHWRDWLTAPPEAPPEPLRLPVRRLLGRDLVALALLAGFLGSGLLLG